MNEKKKPNWFLRIMGLLLIIFTFLYFGSKTGYYEKIIYNKRVMTESQMKKFEKDLSENKEVDLENYVQNDDVDYSNFVTKGANKIANKLTSVFNGEINDIWDFIKALFMG